LSTPQDRGWSTGYPNCHEELTVVVEAAGIPWRVRAEIADLAAAFITAWHETVEPLDIAQCGSFACRAIRGRSTPSLHSWALAFDLNSLLHPLGARGTFTARQVRKIRALLALPWFRNFRWGGDFTTRADEQHVEYVGTVADAANDTRAINATEEDDVTDEDIAKIVAQTATAVNGKVDAQLKQTEKIMQNYQVETRAALRNLTEQVEALAARLNS